MGLQLILLKKQNGTSTFCPLRKVLRGAWKYRASVRPVLLALSEVQFLPDFYKTHTIG